MNGFGEALGFAFGTIFEGLRIAAYGVWVLLCVMAGGFWIAFKEAIPFLFLLALALAWAFLV